MTVNTNPNIRESSSFGGAEESLCGDGDKPVTTSAPITTTATPTTSTPTTTASGLTTTSAGTTQPS